MLQEMNFLNQNKFNPNRTPNFKTTMQVLSQAKKTSYHHKYKMTTLVTLQTDFKRTYKQNKSKACAGRSIIQAPEVLDWATCEAHIEQNSSKYLNKITVIMIITIIIGNSISITEIIEKERVMASY